MSPDLLIKFVFRENQSLNQHDTGNRKHLDGRDRGRDPMGTPTRAGSSRLGDHVFQCFGDNIKGPL